MILPPEDMPVTKDGIVPDILINPHCLSGNTMITMASGTKRRIDEIYNKDFEIKTVNPITLEMSVTKYKSGFKIFPVNEMVEIVCKNGERIKCTEDHKFLTIESAYYTWKEAHLLEENDYIVNMECGMSVVSWVMEIEKEYVYDFTTVSENHSFIANGMVSHNCIPSL